MTIFQILNQNQERVALEADVEIVQDGRGLEVEVDVMGIVAVVLVDVVLKVVEPARLAVVETVSHLKNLVEEIVIVLEAKKTQAQAAAVVVLQELGLLAAKDQLDANVANFFI